MNDLPIWDNCSTLEHAATDTQGTEFLSYLKQELTLELLPSNLKYAGCIDTCTFIILQYFRSDCDMRESGR